MSKFYTSLFLALCNLPVFGQVSFDQLPRDLQLYPRNTAGVASIAISGQVITAGWSKIGVQVLREGKMSQILSQSISPGATNTTFQFMPQIKAEPAEYSVRVFLYKNNDSTLVAARNRIVCGDVYVLYGQSNAVAGGDLDKYYSFNFDDKYMRNAMYPFNSSNIPGEMSWYAAKQPYANVGGFGLTLQRLILENYGIPTCILNGADGGANIATLTTRDPLNHANLNTIYGRLLYRAQWAGVAKQIKGIIWKQGEADAGGAMTSGKDYGEKFAMLYSQFREDYGDARVYVSQINILQDQHDEAAAVRDVQRRTKYLFKNVETIATIGARLSEDGVHYSGETNQQLAFEQFRQIARDSYRSTDTVQINSPDIKKVFYNTHKDTLTLVFDEGMQMVYKADTSFYSYATGAKLYTRALRDYFYLDGRSGSVTGGSAIDNRIILSLKQSTSAKTIRYLPAYFSDEKSRVYDGPTLRNTRGMRAFSFDNVPVADAIAIITTLTARAASEKQVQLKWTASASTTSQILERADETPIKYKPIATLSGTTTTYIDNLPNQFGTYYYRLKAYNDVSESDYSNVVSVLPLVLATEPTISLVRVYPNPIFANSTLHIEAERFIFTNVIIRDLSGRAVKSWTGIAHNSVTIALDNLHIGIYIADLRMADGQVLHRKIIIH